MTSNLSLNAKFAALQAEREKSFTPEALRLNKTQRQELLDNFDPAQAIQAGQPVEPFTLDLPGGGAIGLDDLVSSGPAVLIFFRFATCPACNIALPHYDLTLRPALQALGIPLVAISPQIPERLHDIADRHALGFPVATDRDNTLARRFGLVFEPNAENRAAALAAGNFTGDVTGTGTWELPYPAVIVIGPDRKVVFSAISPDWLHRTESAEIIAAVRQFADAAPVE